MFISYSLGEGPPLWRKTMANDPKSWILVANIIFECYEDSMLDEFGGQFFVHFWSVRDQNLGYLGSWKTILGTDGLRFETLGVNCDSACDYDGQWGKMSDSGGSQMGSKMKPEINKMRQKNERRIKLQKY